MNAMQTDIQNGEIIRIGFTSMGHYADVAMRKGRVSELVRVQLEAAEYRQIHSSDVEKVELNAELHQNIISRAFSAACFQ